MLRQRLARFGVPLVAVAGWLGCDSQQVLDPAATQPGTMIASVALRDALDRLVPAIPDPVVEEALRETLAPLERHLRSGDLVHARTTLWHVTRILDAHRTHADPAVRAELGAIRLAVWVVYDYLKTPFEG